MRFKLLVTLVLLIISACNSERWGKVVIDTALVKDAHYRNLLDKKIEYEYNFAKQKPDTLRGSSGVDYKVIGDAHQNKFSTLYKCKSYFSGDTLKINIGIGNGHAGNGFIISYLNNRFYTAPYLYSLTVNGVEDSASEYRIVHQSLILDRLNYQIGDSIWGKIKFKSIETNIDKKEIEHIGEGYFRAKIN
jgi:hypothetical protein